MPIAFIFVIMITLLTGWHDFESSTREKELILDVEASAVANNMASYRDQIVSYARFINASNLPVNQTAFMSFTGDAQTFIATVKAAGNQPLTMTWFPGPMPGVSCQLSAGVITMSYNPPSLASASKRGVQAALLRITKESASVGHVL